MATTTATTPLPSTETIERAVKSLLKWRASKSETQKLQLLEHDEFIYLILTLKKIPQNPLSRINAHKIPLPHPLINSLRDNPELCLIIDDRSLPKFTLTKDAAKKKLQKDNIPISKIIQLSKLKTDFRPFEAKRKLCDSFDMFFADKRVIPLLPKMLGKQFFKKRKIPVAVDLVHKNWKEQIERACGSALLYLRSGTCSVVKVGRLSMGKDEIVENVVAAIEGIAGIVPRQWGGIRSFHLKLLESLALPVYQALPDLKLRIESGKEGEVVEKENVKEDNLGRKRKGRIHEVRYMDNYVNVGEVFDADDDHEVGSDGEGVINEELESKKRKKVEKEKVEKKVKVLKDKGRKEKVKAKSEDGIKKKKQQKEGLADRESEVKDKKKKKKRFTAE